VSAVEYTYFVDGFEGNDNPAAFFVEAAITLLYSKGYGSIARRIENGARDPKRRYTQMLNDQAPLFNYDNAEFDDFASGGLADAHPSLPAYLRIQAKPRATAPLGQGAPEHGGSAWADLQQLKRIRPKELLKLVRTALGNTDKGLKPAALKKAAKIIEDAKYENKNSDLVDSINEAEKAMSPVWRYPQEAMLYRMVNFPASAAKGLDACANLYTIVRAFGVEASVDNVLDSYRGIISIIHEAMHDVENWKMEDMYKDETDEDYADRWVLVFRTKFGNAVVIHANLVAATGTAEAHLDVVPDVSYVALGQSMTADHVYFNDLGVKAMYIFANIANSAEVEEEAKNQLNYVFTNTLLERYDEKSMGIVIDAIDSLHDDDRDGYDNSGKAKRSAIHTMYEGLIDAAVADKGKNALDISPELVLQHYFIYMLEPQD